MKCLLRFFDPVPVAASVARAAQPNLADNSGCAGDEGFGIDNDNLDLMGGATGADQHLAAPIVLYVYDPVLGQRCRVNSTGDIRRSYSSPCDLERCLGKTVSGIENGPTKTARSKRFSETVECLFANGFGSVNSHAPMSKIKQRFLLGSYLSRA